MALSKREAISIWVREEGACFWCDRDLDPSEVEFDHWMPVDLGGSDDLSNIVLSCFTCNREKGALHPRRYERRMHAGKCLGDRWFEHEEANGCEYKPPLFDIGCGRKPCADPECPSSYRA